jgi:hypothetical protein
LIARQALANVWPGWVMKAGAALIIIAGIGALCTAGYAFNSAREFSQAVDARFEREFADADLTIIREQLRDNGGGAAPLSALYRGPMNEELNLRYARLVANWNQAYPRLTRIPLISDGNSDVERLAIEIDERLGPGTSAVMQAQYEQYRREAPLREAAHRAEEERRRAESEAVIRYIENYMRQHGKFPDQLPTNP